MRTLLAGEDGWQPVEHFNTARTTESYLSGDPDSRRVRVRYFKRLADDALMARVWFGPGSQGPPGHVHGGALAAVLDEAMGFAAWMAGHRVVAARIEVDFRTMVPLDAVASVEARVESVDGRKVSLRARLELADGTLAAASNGLFIELAPKQLERLAGLAERAHMDPEAFG